MSPSYHFQHKLYTKSLLRAQQQKGISNEVTLITKIGQIYKSLLNSEQVPVQKTQLQSPQSIWLIFSFVKEGCLVVIPVVPGVLLLLRSSTFTFWVLTFINRSFVFLSLPGIRKGIHGRRRVETRDSVSWRIQKCITSLIARQAQSKYFIIDPLRSYICKCLYFKGEIKEILEEIMLEI